MTDSTKFYHVAIVGAGPAGLSAAVNASSEGLDVALVECAKSVGGQAKYSSRIENYLGFPSGLTGASLMSRAANQAARFGTHFYVGNRCVTLEREGRLRCLKLADGHEIICRAVLISCGLNWRKLKAPGVNELYGKGVHYGANMSDAALYAGREIVIIGGANSAGQAAMYFSQTSHVTLIVRADSLDAGMSQYLVDRIQKNKNIEVMTGCEVTDALGPDRLFAVIVAKGAERVGFCIPASAMFIFIGAEPRTEWLKGSCEMDDKGFIQSSEDKHTSCEGVFVAGDVRAGSTKRIAGAVGEGANAVAQIHVYLSKT